MDRKEYDVAVKLVGNQKPCHSGHKVGDEWLFQFQPLEGMCFAAYNTLFPFILVLKCGGTFPWQEDPDTIVVSCPDPEVNNVFELRRIPRE